MAQKTLLIGIDGLLLERGLASGKAPFLREVKQRAFYTDIRIESITISGPSWSTILTGATNDQHQVLDNDFNGHQLHLYPDFLTLASAKNPRVRTFAAAGWLPLLDPRSPAPIIRERKMDQLAGRHVTFYKDGDTLGYETVDAEVAAFAQNHISLEGPELNFVYFSQVDEFGHKYGALDDPYFDALGRVDQQVKNLHEVIEDRVKNFGEEWIVLITTDHGHLDEGGHGGDSDQERSSFLIAYGVGRENPQWEAPIAQHQISQIILHSMSTLTT
jgi:predicted AlkP superfamily pyrophosphatase or phosphodiesterase